MERRDIITAAVAFAAAEGVRATDAAAPRRDGAAAATSLERSAGVTIAREDVVPGDVRRYGAAADGASDDSPAWRAAVATGHRVLGGGAECIYRLDGQVVITRSTVIDLQGATIRPGANTFAFVRTPPPPSASSDVLRGANQGGRSLTVRNVAGFKIGQWARLILNDAPLHDASSYPPSWSHVVAVLADSVELDTPLQITYGEGPLRLAAYDPGVLCERFECRNGVFDGSQSTYDQGTGQALRIGGAERVVIRDCEFRDFRHAGQLTCAVELFTNVDAELSGCRFTGSVSSFDICDIQEARFAHFVNNQIAGSHFGCNLTRVDYGLFANNSLHGQRAYEAESGVTPVRSARGLKAYGCAAIRILANHAADYESPIKVQACFRYDVSHNTIFNAGLSPYSGQIALNIGSITRGRNMRDGRIIGNHVESCGGIGIGVSSDPPGGVFVSGNIVRATQGTGIFINVPSALVSANRVEDWGLRGSGDAAIHVSSATSLVDNRFAHSTRTSLPCISSASGASHVLTRDNVSETGNPLGP
jgi:hypothetical protein